MTGVNTQPYGSAMPKRRVLQKDRLSAAAWIAGAARALEAGGAAAVRVEPLAAALGVTKGSFYWHFKDRDALLDAMLDHWERQSTLATIEILETAWPDARSRLRGLLALVHGNPRKGAEAAIRAWALSDPRAAAAVRRVDSRRENYVAGLLRQMGLGEAAARQRARLMGLSVVGDIASAPYNPTRQAEAFWQTALELFIADLAP